MTVTAAASVPVGSEGLVFHPYLNGELTPQSVTKGCNKAVWWQCGEGHVWKARVCARTRPKGTGCPVCAGRKPKGVVRQLAEEEAAAKRARAGQGKPTAREIRPAV